jgi:hypothetical protein
MKTTGLALSFAIVAGFVGLAAQTVPIPKTDRALTDKAVTVAGCVAAGAEADTYTLQRATIVGSPGSSSPTPAGTSGAGGTEKSSSMEHGASYQLKGDNLKVLVGQQVEAIGTTSDAQQPDKAASVGNPEPKKETLPILTVTSVKSVSATCS